MLESVHSKWFFPHFSRHLLSQRPVLCLLQNNAAKNCIWCNDSHLVSQNNFLGGKWQEHKACLSGLGKEALAVRGSSSQGVIMHGVGRASHLTSVPAAWKDGGTSGRTSASFLLKQRSCHVSFSSCSALG